MKFIEILYYQETIQGTEKIKKVVVKTIAVNSILEITPDNFETIVLTSQAEYKVKEQYHSFTKRIKML